MPLSFGCARGRLLERKTCHPADNRIPQQIRAEIPLLSWRFTFGEQHVRKKVLTDSRCYCNFDPSAAIIPSDKTIV
jgi:hypothetical protein